MCSAGSGDFQSQTCCGINSLLAWGALLKISLEILGLHAQSPTCVQKVPRAPSELAHLMQIGFLRHCIGPAAAIVEPRLSSMSELSVRLKI